MNNDDALSRMKTNDKISLGLFSASVCSLFAATFTDNEDKEISAGKWFIGLFLVSIGYKIITDKYIK